MKGSRPRNIYELAELAGVTSSAVSLALHDSPQISDGLKEKIKRIVKESGFTPRKYSKRTIGRWDSRQLGKVLFVRYSSEEEDTVNIELENAAIGRLNYYGAAFDIRSVDEIVNDPALLEAYSGVIYYFDPPGLAIPAEKKCVQIFGFKPLLEGHDRITANDEQIARLAFERLLSSGMKVAVMVYRDDMVIGNWHPRIEFFRRLTISNGLKYIDFKYQREDSEAALWDRLYKIIKGSTPDIGFFGFNDICAFKLYMQLNANGHWNAFKQGRVVCGDTSHFLKKFWPQDFLIELSLKELANKAVDRLLEKLRGQDTYGATIMLEARGISKDALL